MRVRIRALMEAHGFTTAYQLAKASNGRIHVRTAQRLVRENGALTQFSGPLLDALCDIFAINDMNRLIERGDG